MSEYLKFRWNVLQLQGAQQFQDDALMVRLAPSGDQCGGGCRIAVADGEGSHGYGALASQLAVEMAINSSGVSLGDLPSYPRTAEQWRALFVEFHEAISEWVAPRSKRHRIRPATALMACSVEPDGGYSLAMVGSIHAWEVTSTGVRRLCGRHGSEESPNYGLGRDIAGGAAVQFHSGKLKPGGKLVLATQGVESIGCDTLEHYIGLPIDLAMVELHRDLVRAGREPANNVTLVMLEARP